MLGGVWWWFCLCLYLSQLRSALVRAGNMGHTISMDTNTEEIRMAIEVGNAAYPGTRLHPVGWDWFSQNPERRYEIVPVLRPDV